MIWEVFWQTVNIWLGVLLGLGTVALAIIALLTVIALPIIVVGVLVEHYIENKE